MEDKRKIFISHPFANDPEGNREKVDRICKELSTAGFLPVSPLHLFSFMEDDRDREQILNICYYMIANCNELWAYGDSDGCRKEIAAATKMGIPVRIMYDQKTGRPEINLPKQKYKIAAQFTARIAVFRETQDYQGGSVDQKRYIESDMMMDTIERIMDAQAKEPERLLFEFGKVRREPGSMSGTTRHTMETNVYLKR